MRQKHEHRTRTISKLQFYLQFSRPHCKGFLRLLAYFNHHSFLLIFFSLFICVRVFLWSVSTSTLQTNFHLPLNKWTETAEKPLTRVIGQIAMFHRCDWNGNIEYVSRVFIVSLVSFRPTLFCTIIKNHKWFGISAATALLGDGIQSSTCIYYTV